MAKLTGRRNECDILDQFVDAVRGGASRAFVVNGEAGVGKTALLEYIADHAEGCRVVRALGVQTEMELAFATLHQLCAPLLPESVGLVLGTRALSDDVAGFEHLAVAGLREADARALLETALAVPIDAQVRDQIVAETGGNPLALLELPRTLTAAELAGGFGLPGVLRLPGSVEESFQRRVSALPGETRRLLVLAAADPVGDAAITSRAAGRLGIGPGAAEPAAKAGLAELGVRIPFCHPLVRSVVYRSASGAERRQAHAALAAAIDPALDADRHAWHRAQSVSGPDEDVAMELERSAGRARARGGLSATAAFLERATMLTPDPAQRARRALDAAQAKMLAGAFDAALDLLAVAEVGPVGELEQARPDLVRAQITFAKSRGTDAAPLPST